MEKEPSGFVDVDFSYTDEVSNKTTLVKTVNVQYIDESELGVLNDLFHDFVLACGFSYLSNKHIEWIDD